MRRAFLTIAALATMLVAPALTTPAQAMTNPLPAGIAEAITDVSNAQNVRYVCRRICSWRGCWRRCWHTGPRSYGYYTPYPYYSYRWHRRHWRPWRYW